MFATVRCIHQIISPEKTNHKNIEIVLAVNKFVLQCTIVLHVIYLLFEVLPHPAVVRLRLGGYQASDLGKHIGL